jgi:methylmalonyl-CoA mutase
MFAPHSYQDWLASLEKPLAPIMLDEGVAIQPLYMREHWPHEHSAVSPSTAQWQICQIHTEFNEQELCDDFKNTVEVFFLQMPDHELQQALNELDLHKAQVRSFQSAALLMEAWKKCDLATVRGACHAPQLALWAAHEAPHITCVLIEIPKLPSVVSMLTAAFESYRQHLTNLMQQGLSALSANSQIRLQLPLGTDVFVSMATLRALRKLCVEYLATLQVEEAPDVYIDAQTSLDMYETEEPHNNINRATLVAFAAAASGASSIMVHPADGLSRRLARNISLILKHECALDQVADPAGGSWYLERLTQTLFEKVMQKVLREPHAVNNVR